MVAWLTAFRANLQISRSARRVIRAKVEKKLPDFVRLIADLIDEANGNCQTAEPSYQGLVILIDGFEKAVTTAEGQQRVSSILIEHAEQWGTLKVPLVFTGPLELFTENTRLQNLFDDVILMPAVPVTPRPTSAGTEAQDYAQRGRALLRQLVSRRVKVPDVFESEDVLDTLIERSGGSIRELFRLIREAIDQAIDHPITSQDAAFAIKQLELGLGPALRHVDLPLLQRVINDPTDFDYSEESLSLLHRELVIPYSNGGVWYGVHPAIRHKLP